MSDEWVKQQCNYCGKKSKIYGEIVLYTDPYGDQSTNYMCLDCYVEKQND